MKTFACFSILLIQPPVQIKVTKLNNYEAKYQQRIETTRKVEHNLLKTELYFWAISLLMQAITPVLASAAAFTTYVTVNDSHILTPAKTFTVLLFFSALRFPIAYFGRLVGRAALAMEALRRLESFVNRPTRSENLEKGKLPHEMEASNKADTDDDASGVVLSVKDATFVFEAPHRDESASRKSSSRELAGFSAADINLSLQPGQVLAVVGPVAAGKSTIINGMIDEVSALPGTKISMRGKVSYVSQTPFIMNATVRDNVLFGLAYDPDWYHQVLDACCLRQDLKQIGAAGDLTEIGERGVTLSGGKSFMSLSTEMSRCKHAHK